MTIEPSSNVVDNDDNIAPKQIVPTPGVTASQTGGHSDQCDDSDEALFVRPSAITEEMVEASRNRSTPSSPKRSSQNKEQTTLQDQPPTTGQLAAASELFNVNSSASGVIKIITASASPRPSTSRALPTTLQPSTSEALSSTMQASNLVQQAAVETQPPSQVSTQSRQQTREF